MKSNILRADKQQTIVSFLLPGNNRKLNASRKRNSISTLECLIILLPTMGYIFLFGVLWWCFYNTKTCINWKHHSQQNYQKNISFNTRNWENDICHFNNVISKLSSKIVLKTTLD